MRYVEVRRHTMRVKPGQHLSQAGVTLARRLGDEIGPFDLVITSEIPRAFETAIAMGFAVTEQSHILNMMADEVEAELNYEHATSFADYAAAAQQGGAIAAFAKRLAAYLQAVAEAVSEGGAALLVTHGGLIEVAAVGCLPDADFAGWGGLASYCDGVRLQYEAGQWVGGEVLRVS